MMCKRVVPPALALATVAVLYLPTLQTTPNGGDHFYMADVGETQIVLNLWGPRHRLPRLHHHRESAGRRFEGPALVGRKYGNGTREGLVFGLTLDAQRGFLRLRGICEEPTAGNRLTLAGRLGDNQESSHMP